MPAGKVRNLLVSFGLAALMAIVASLGGSWGDALGQTAGIPPTTLPAGVTPGSAQPDVTPPPAGEYRPPAGTPAASTLIATPAVPQATASPPGTSVRLTAAAGTPSAVPTAIPVTPSPAGSAESRGFPVAGVVAGALAAGGLAGLALWWFRRPGR